MFLSYSCIKPNLLWDVYCMCKVVSIMVKWQPVTASKIPAPKPSWGNYWPYRSQKRKSFELLQTAYCAGSVILALNAFMCMHVWLTSWRFTYCIYGYNVAAIILKVTVAYHFTIFGYRICPLSAIIYEGHLYFPVLSK